MDCLRKAHFCWDLSDDDKEPVVWRLGKESSQWGDYTVKTPWGQRRESKDGSARRWDKMDKQVPHIAQGKTKCLDVY